MDEQIEVGDIWCTSDGNLAVIVLRKEGFYCLEGSIIGCRSSATWTEEGEYTYGESHAYDLKDYKGTLYNIDDLEPPCNPPQKSLTISPDGKTTVSITINITGEVK